MEEGCGREEGRRVGWEIAPFSTFCTSLGVNLIFDLENGHLNVLTCAFKSSQNAHFYLEE